MKRLRGLMMRCGGLFNKRRKDQELDDEIEIHLQLHIEDNLRLGMTPKEARRQALIRLGGVESTRKHRGPAWIAVGWKPFGRTFSYGARILRKNLGFTSVAVLTLALGIGATTAIFSLINAVLLEPLSYEQSGQLVNSLGKCVRMGSPAMCRTSAFMDWREYSTSFEGVSSVRDAAANLTGTGPPERIQWLARFPPNFLSILREQPQDGRSFLPEEERPGGGDKVVVFPTACGSAVLAVIPTWLAT